MRLVIIRHADAGDRDDWERTGRPDAERPLSPRGVEQMRGAAKGLVALVRAIDLIVTSPYTRAVQTAEIVRDAYGGNVRLETSSTLEPDEHPESLAEWLRKRGDAENVAVVGHEPHLGILATWLIAGSDDSHIDMKKGGACCIEFKKAPRKGDGALRWFMGPKQLARLGGS